MTWFKVDDKFHSHRKVAALGDDAGALALWTVAGSWSADQLTDGFVPRHMVPRLLPVSKRRAFSWANSLTIVGLWEVFTNESGEEGWRFHGWNERGRQPSSEQILADREANAVRQAEFRERRKQKRNAITNAITNGVSNKAPTRPDPSLIQQQRAGAGERPTAAPAGATPLIDALAAEGFVVSWDLGFVEWDRVRLAVERSGIPAMVEYARRRNHAAKSPAYSARAWVQGWSTLPALDSNARITPAPPAAIGAPSEAAAVQPRSFAEVMAESERLSDAGALGFNDLSDFFPRPE